jgi:hypothetical protein
MQSVFVRLALVPLDTIAAWRSAAVVAMPGFARRRPVERQPRTREEAVLPISKANGSWTAILAENGALLQMRHLAGDVIHHKGHRDTKAAQVRSKIDPT